MLTEIATERARISQKLVWYICRDFELEARHCFSLMCLVPVPLPSLLLDFGKPLCEAWG